MAIPPFNNTRLNPHEDLTKKKQEELFDAVTRNIEDIYAEFATGTNITELRKAFIKSSEIIRGGVSSEGVPTRGSGFTVTKTATGVYKIVLKTALATEGVPQANSSQFNLLGPRWSVATKSEFVVNWVTPAEAAVNTAFFFVIYPS
jgi:hypothetical protein